MCTSRGLLPRFALPSHESGRNQIIEGSRDGEVAAGRDSCGCRQGSARARGTLPRSTGRSAGLCHRSHPLLAHTMGISALVDLEPISLSWLNEKLSLTQNEIDEYSPLRHIGAGAPTTITVGGVELPELIRHAGEYAAAAAKSGEEVDYVAIANRNHFTILEELASASGAIAKMLARALSR